MTSPLAAAAVGKRESDSLLRKQNMVYCINSITRFLKRYSLWHSDYINRRIDTIFRSNAINQTPWTKEESGLMMIQASHKVFGDPVQLSKDPDKLHSYCVIYHNPSVHTINIRPLGLRDKDNLSMEYVVPGGLVSIPYGYTSGGNRSAVASIAPQLEPLGEQGSQEDRLLDLTPASLAEWITYMSYSLSECCMRQLLWSDRRQCLLCEKCRKETYL